MSVSAQSRRFDGYGVGQTKHLHSNDQYVGTWRFLLIPTVIANHLFRSTDLIRKTRKQPVSPLAVGQQRGMLGH